jgi:Phage lysozyme
MRIRAVSGSVPMNRSLCQHLLIKHEGWRNIAYDDATGKNIESGVPLVGNPTVAVGFNLNRVDAKQVFAQLGILNFNGILQGLEALTDAQVQALLDYTTDEAIADASALLSNFALLPANVQCVVCDMVFNLGRHGLAQFVGFLGALRNYDYNLAAAEAVNSLWCGQVKSRCADDVAILKGAPIE